MNHQALSSALDFSHGISLSRKVRSIYSTPINPLSVDGFHLVVSFAWAIFRLDQPNVSVALQSCLGTDRASLHVTSLHDRVFKFTMNSKAIGFFYLSSSILCLLEVCLLFPSLGIRRCKLALWILFMALWTIQGMTLGFSPEFSSHRS
jgi:hypothetical protein